jgi:hypothetical protein
LPGELVGNALTAFGLGARPGTLQQNINAAIEFIDNSALSFADKAAAKAVLLEGKFDVMIHVLPVTKFDEAEIVLAFKSSGDPDLKDVNVYFDIDLDFQ